MAAGGSMNFVKRGWRNIRQAGPQRLAITAVLVMLAVLIARFSWGVTFIGEAEAGLYDMRSFIVANEQRVDQDKRIAMVVYDEQTLIAARKRSPLDRGVLIAALRNMDGMGAKAIGIDILFDQPQDEDQELVETLRAMETPVSVAFVDMSANADDIVYDQQQYLNEFLAALEGSNARPASIQLSDALGVTRLFPKQNPALPPTMTRDMLDAAGAGDKSLPGYEGAIRFRLGKGDGDRDDGRTGPVTEHLFPKLPIDTFTDGEVLAIPAVAEEIVPVIKDSYVLIGSDLVDFDRVPTTLTEATQYEMPGMQVHAEMMAQMLDGGALPKPLPVTLWAFAALTIILAALWATDD